jgi:putative endonuclease
MVGKDNRSLSNGLHQSLGKHAEELVAKYYKQLGFQLVASNYRYGKAEIDLIVQNNTCLVFVEVKARTSVKFGYPESFVSLNQQNLIREAAENYVLTHQWHATIRFDIVAVLRAKQTYQISHFEDAF